MARVLETYAARGVFRGFSPGAVRAGRAVFKIVWHRDRKFELIVDVSRSSLRFPVVLPDIPAGSPMFRELRQFVASRHSSDLAEHRRIDAAKARVHCGTRSGDVSMTLDVLDGDFEYGVRKLVGLVHEIYLVFLFDGRYYDYMVEKFDLDPDRL